MVNAFGYYASAKGMVLVPNLSGLSSSAAISALEIAGLEYSLGADVNTETQSLDNLVAQQNPTQGTLVDYQTVVSFNLYNYVPVTVSPTVSPTVAPATTTYWYTGCCSTTNTQVTGTSTVSLSAAQTAMNSQCSGSITAVQSGSYTSSSNIPSINCSAVQYYCRVVELGVDQGTLAPSSTDQTSCFYPQAILCFTTGYPTLVQVNAYCDTTQQPTVSPTISPDTSVSPSGSVTPGGGSVTPGGGSVTPAPTVVDTTYGPCNQQLGGTCPGGGVQDVTVRYSDNSSTTTPQCCTYFE